MEVYVLNSAYEEVCTYPCWNDASMGALSDMSAEARSSSEFGGVSKGRRMNKSTNFSSSAAD